MSLKVSGDCFISRMDLKYSQGGTPICKFSIKTSKKDKDGQWQPEWYNGVCFKDTAEKVGGYGDGQRVKIEGILSSHSYEKDGQKRTAIEIVAFDVEPVGEVKERPAAERLIDDSIPF